MDVLWCNAGATSANSVLPRLSSVGTRVCKLGKLHDFIATESDKVQHQDRDGILAASGIVSVFLKPWCWCWYQDLLD
jgi:hypothetical protein